MTDDSELDYIKKFLRYICVNSTVKHISDTKRIFNISDNRRILIYPGELIGMDGKFRTKRYKVQISEPSEVYMMATFNAIVEGIDNLNKNNAIGGTKGTAESGYFDVSARLVDIAGIAWDGAHYWISASLEDLILRFDENFNYEGSQFDIDTSNEIPSNETGALCFDGTYLWCAAMGNGKIYKYDLQGNYQSVLIDCSAKSTDVYGVDYDGTHFWVYSGSTDQQVLKYTYAGAFVSEFDTSAKTGNLANGLVFADDLTELWIIDAGENKAFIYTTAGAYDSEYAIYTTGYDGTFNGTHICVITYNNGRIYRYQIPYVKPDSLIFIKLAYASKDEEVGTAKRWRNDLYLDIEWYE